MDHPIPKEILDRITWSKIKQEGDIPKVKSIAHAPAPCEDCGRMVENRIIRSSVSQSSNHYPHVKHHCQICKKYRNPITGKYEWDFTTLNLHFYRRKKEK